MDLFDVSEDNQALYKVVATHIAGRFEYGTYDFDLDALAARGWTPPSLPADDAASHDIISFIACIKFVISCRAILTLPL